MNRIPHLVFAHTGAIFETYNLVMVGQQATYEHIIQMPDSEVFTDLLTEEQFLYNINLYLDNPDVQLCTTAL